MTRNEHLLTCLAEECAEVGQRVSKALRFGLQEVQPGQPLTNAERIVEELGDLMAVVQMLTNAGLLSMQDPDYDKKIAEKIRKVERFMRYAQEQGTLEPTPSHLRKDAKP